MENLIKKADISLYGIDDELKNNSSSIYTTKLNSSQYQTITYNTTNYTTSHGYEIFTYTGAIQTFKIPSGTTSVNVYCWGAGGGSSKSNSGTAATRGGNGGFVKATLTIPSGATSLGIIVGQGGAKGVYSPAGLTRTAFGGGGAGVDADPAAPGWAIAGGGGLSGVFVNDANFTIVSSYYVNTSATALIIAGGGGGAGAYDAGPSGSTDGGNGGFTTANDGSGNRPGGGGTPSAGGSAGTTADGWAQGTAGSKYLGGSGTLGSYTAGGGGGYFGGGAGGVNNGQVSGGGGGSSFINTGSYTITNITNDKTLTNGTATAPGNTETYYSAGVALGGFKEASSTTLNDGGNGLVIIEYLINNTSINSNLLNGGIFNYNTNYNLHYLNNSNYSVKFTEGKIEIGTLPTKPSTDYINLFKNPIAWYKFDGSTALLINDSSGNGYNLTNNGATFNNTIYRKGDGSAYFNGTQYMTNRSFYDLNGISWSMSFWCYSTINTYGTFNILGSIGEILSGSITDYNYFQIGNFDGRWSVGAVYDATYTQIQEQNTWVHLVYTFNSVGTNKQEKLYRNGNLYHSVSTKTANWNFPNQVIEIGRRTLTDSRSYWTGYVDDFRFYNYELTAEEANVLYNNRYIDSSYPLLKDNTGTTINPIAWYKFDNRVLTTDSSGNGYNLTLVGTPTFDNTNFTKGNGAVSITTNNYLSGSGININDTNFSFSFWSYPQSSTKGCIIFFGTPGTNTGVFVGYGLTGFFTNQWIAGNYAVGGDLASSSLNDVNTWVHIVYTVNISTKNRIIYRNGVKLVEGTTVNNIATVSTAFNLGYIQAGFEMEGKLDDFRYYNRTLTPTEVNELYLGRVDILSTNTLKSYYTNNNPYLLLDKTIDGVNYLITTKPSSFIKKNTKKYLFTLTSSIRQLKLSDKAKLIIKSIFIPNVISKSYLQSKAINNVIVKMKEINRNNYLFNSLGNNGNPVIFTSPLKLNTQGFGTTYSFASLPDKNSQSQQSRNLNSDNNGYLFLNPSQDYLFVYDINQDFIENGSIELEVIYDITTVFQNYNETNTYNYIYESLDYTTDRDCLEGLNVNFIIKDVDDSNEMVYEEKSLLNQINNLLLEY